MRPFKPIFFNIFRPRNICGRVIIFRKFSEYVISSVQCWASQYPNSGYTNDVLAPLIGWQPGELTGRPAPWSGPDRLPETIGIVSGSFKMFPESLISVKFKEVQ